MSNLSGINPANTTTLNGISCSFLQCVSVGMYDASFDNSENLIGSTAFTISGNQGNNFANVSFPVLPVGANNVLPALLGQNNLPQ